MRTMRMLFFVALVLSCKPAGSQNDTPIVVGAPLLGRVIKLCGATVYQEHPGREINVVGNKDVSSIVTVSSDGYTAVMYLPHGAKNTINAHLLRDKQVTIKVELVELDGSRDGMEKCRPEAVTVQ